MSGSPDSYCPECDTCYYDWEADEHEYPCKLAARWRAEDKEKRMKEGYKGDHEPHDAIALFDLDGTLADYDTQMRADFSRLCSPGEPHIANPSASELPWVCARTKLIRRQPGWWEKLPRFQLGFDILEIARELDFENHVLTKGPDTTESAWTEKKTWCTREVPDLAITITQKKSLMYGKVLSDDWPGYYLPWLKVRPRGLVVVPAQPWNEGHTDHPNIVRYDGTNLDEVRARMQATRESAG